MNNLQIAILILVALFGSAVVFVRDPRIQTIALSFYGLLLTVLFFAFQAPDVALSQIVVGAIALPLMVLLTLARMKKSDEQS